MQYKTHYGIVLLNLHYYSFLSASFVGRNCNTCSYANKSHDQNRNTLRCNYTMYLTKCHRNVGIKNP